MRNRYERHIDDDERRRFLRALGVAGAAGVVGEFTLGDLRGELTLESAGELATMGEAVRGDLSGAIDAALVGAELSALADEVRRVPALREAGVPETVGTAFQDLTDPAWRITDHLAGVDFFASAERHLPPFVPEHVAASTKQLVEAGALGGALSGLGFSEEELTAVAMNAVNNDDHLAKWMPTDAYPAEEVEEFDPANVAPMHRRAAEGALNWIDGLDWWLWQNEVLVTEAALAKGVWDVKAMLGGVYLLGRAARGVATGEVADDELAAAVTAGSAIAIMNQENLANDLVRLTDGERAPRRVV